MDWPISWNDVKKELERTKTLNLAQYEVLCQGVMTLLSGGTGTASDSGTFWEDVNTDGLLRLEVPISGSASVFTNVNSTTVDHGKVISVEFSLMVMLGNQYVKLTVFIGKGSASVNDNTANIVVKAEQVNTGA